MPVFRQTILLSSFDNSIYRRHGSTCLYRQVKYHNPRSPVEDSCNQPLRTNVLLGRSVNECRQQFQNMWQSSHPPASIRSTESWQAPPPPPGYPVFNPSPANAAPLTSSSAHDPYASRKRPLYSTEKPNLPRAIQPRPPHSNVQFGHDAGSPGPISPGWGDHLSGKGGPEPPRKRGRPSKMESERRKAEAEARGESYPPPRRRLSKTKNNPATPSGGASATSDSSMVSPMHVAHTPEIQKQERLPDTPAPRDIPPEKGVNTQPGGADALDTPDTDPVKGIIRSQNSQDRRLPLPFPPSRESFSMQRTSPREPLLSQTTTVFDATPAPRPQEKTMHPPPAEPRILAQAQSGPPMHQSGGYVTAAISPHPGETKT
jgi:hypothetical protein